MRSRKSYKGSAQISVFVWFWNVLSHYVRKNADDLKWRLEDGGNSYFYPINKKSGKYACITSSSTADSAAAHQWEKVNADDLKWKFEAV